MKTGKIFLMTAMAMLLGIAVIARADDAQRGHEMMMKDHRHFMMMDDDGDGRISKKEWNRYHRDDTMFKQMDVNHNGYIDADEMPHGK